MNATQKLIALAMERTGSTSQTELAEKTGLSKQMVSFYINGRSAIQKPEHIAAICLLIGEDPQKWFAALAAEGSEKSEVHAWARRLGAAAAIFLAVALPYQSHASVSSSSVSERYADIGIMRSVTIVFAAAAILRATFPPAKSGSGHGPSALLA